MLFVHNILKNNSLKTRNSVSGNGTSEDGDIVLVAPGIYDVNEPITYRGKKITLKSIEGPLNTIIDGKNQTNIFTFNSGETNDAVLEGFTITGGNNAWMGGGIYCGGSSPIIRNNIIKYNTAGDAGGIYCGGASPLIISNIISENGAFSKGGGIGCEYSHVLILNNIIERNSVCDDWGGGIYCDGHSSIVVEDNIIIGNAAYEKGGGICIIGQDSGSTVIIKNNIIAKNRANERGGGIYWNSASLSIIENTVIDNSTSDYGGGGIDYFGDGEALPFNINNIIYDNIPTDLSGIEPSQVFYSDISQEGFAGINGNICANPLLVNPNPDPNTLDDLINNGNIDGARDYLRECYSLQPNSPCIDAGDHEYLDPDGTRSDIGAFYFDKRNLDLYRDDIINLKDYAVFANTWLTTGKDIPGDIYIDNKVDYKDLEILTENWLNSCED